MKIPSNGTSLRGQFGPSECTIMSNHYEHNSFVLQFGALLIIGGIVSWLDGDGFQGVFAAVAVVARPGLDDQPATEEIDGDDID